MKFLCFGKDEDNNDNDDKDLDENGNKKRQMWNNRAIYLITQIGSAVGLGNLWRFPYLAFKNGGGAFLIPYFISLIFLGFPLMILELSMGQLYKQGVVGVFRSINKRTIGVGIFHIITTFMILSYYCNILTWVLWYLLVSIFQKDLPFQKNPEQYFLHEFLHVGAAQVQFNYVLILFLAIVWTLVFLSISLGIKSSGIISVILSPFCPALLLVFFFRGIALDGALDGIFYYLTPDFSMLMKPSIWMDAAGQIFFSIGLAGGVIPALSSFGKHRQDVVVDNFIITCSNSAIEIFCGFIVFSYLGNLAHVSKKTIPQVAAGGPDLAFIVFPDALSKLPESRIFSISFFLILFILGITSAYTMAQAFSTSLTDRWPKRLPPIVSSAIVCFSGFLFGIMYTCNIGYFLIDLVDHYTSMMLLAGGIAECIAIGWTFQKGKINYTMKQMFLYQNGDDVSFYELKEHISTVEYIRLTVNQFTKIKLPFLWSILIRFIIPVVVSFLLVITVVKNVNYGGYPLWMQVTFGWLPIAISIFILFFFIIFKSFDCNGNGDDNDNNDDDDNYYTRNNVSSNSEMYILKKNSKKMLANKIDLDD